MNIKVLGTGCPTCKILFKNVEEVISEIGINATLEKEENIKEIMKYGVMSLPALVINEKVIFSGKNPGKEELKKYIFEENK
jgi:small redox-active disulfide protein 2